MAGRGAPAEMLIHMYNCMAMQRKPPKPPKRAKPATQSVSEKVQIPVFVTPEDRRSLKMTALELDTTMGALVEGLIRDFLARRAK